MSGGWTTAVHDEFILDSVQRARSPAANCRASAAGPRFPTACSSPTPNCAASRTA